jgi:hypothetical protein
MPSATIEAKTTAQLIFLGTPEQAGEVRAWARRAKISLSDLMRRAFWGPGWPELARNLADEYGALTNLERLQGELEALPAPDRATFAAQHGLDYSPPARKVRKITSGRKAK